MAGSAVVRLAEMVSANDIPLTGSLLGRRLLRPFYCAVRYDGRVRLFHACAVCQEVQRLE